MDFKRSMHKTKIKINKTEFDLFYENRRKKIVIEFLL